MSSQIQQYNTLAITTEELQKALDICVQNAALHAGICCNSLRQLVEINQIIEDDNLEIPPWSIELTQRNRNGIIIKFTNGSILDIFAGRESCRGKRFHYLIVDESVNQEIQTHVLRYLIRDYKFSEESMDDDCQDLFLFAEATLQKPLNNWQKEMLAGLVKGEIYIVGRNLGKQEILNIYKEWKETPATVECCPCEYTYDQIMAGIPENQFKADTSAT